MVNVRVQMIRIVVVALVALIPLAGVADDRLMGHYNMTLTDDGLKCGGCEAGAKTETGELDPVDVTIRWDQGGEYFRSDIGSVRAENANGFGYAGADLRCFLQLWSGSVDEVELGGGRNAGWHGKANEQGDLRGDVTTTLTPIPGAEDGQEGVHSVWKLSGSFQGGIYHTGSNDSWSDSHGPTGREMGMAKGSFMVYLYVSLPSELKVDETKLVCIVEKGRVYSVSRKRMVGPGEYLYQGDFIMVRPEDDGFAAHYVGGGGTMYLEPGSAFVAVTPAARDYEYSTGEIIYRFIKGLGIFQINRRDGKYTVETPHTHVGTLGTRFALESDGDMTRVSMLEGAVKVTDLDGEYEFVVETPNSAAITDEGHEVTALPASQAAYLNAKIEPYLGGAVGKLIRCTNKYDAKVTVHITWRETDGSWHKVRWSIPGGASGLLKIDGVAVLADRVIYWAENEDGTLVWRRSLKETVVDITGTDGDTWSVTLNAPQ